MDILLLQAKIDALAKKLYPPTLIPSPSLYIISLENDCLFFHYSQPKPETEILEECQNKYEYVRVNAPIKILYEMKDFCIEEVDPLVKKFMHMFGVDNTRGGSYTDIILQNCQTETLKLEFAFLKETPGHP
jgi:hypothetical protein